MADSNMPVDDRFLAAMGLKGLEGEEKQDALRSILFTLNVNVGRRVVEQFIDEQADEFERLSRPGADPEKLAYWIALNVPNHKQIIEEETRKLRNDTVNFVDDMMQKSQPSAKEEGQQPI
jgi:protein associated with RNAse G/E